jgi:hypothetical protein
MSTRYRFFESLDEKWVGGSYTSEPMEDFFESARFCVQARRVQLAPGVSAHVEVADKPRKLLVVAEANTPFDGATVDGIGFFQITEFQQGQQWFYRKVVVEEEGSVPTSAPYGGGFGGGCAI